MPRKKKTSIVKSISPVPAGMYIELNVDAINEGEFRAHLDRAIQRGFREYIEWEDESGRTDGMFEIQATLKFSRMPDSNEHFIIEDRVKLKTPDLSHQSVVKGKNGRLICQPEGTSLDDPNQIRLFDSHGRPKANFDPTTGEIIDDNDEDVAGKVGTAS